MGSPAACLPQFEYQRLYLRRNLHVGKALWTLRHLTIRFLRIPCAALSTCKEWNGQCRSGGQFWSQNQSQHRFQPPTTTLYFPFFFCHTANIQHRIKYQYLLCSVSIDTLHIPIGLYIEPSERSSILNEVACKLADLTLVKKHGIPLEDMCNENGEFIEPYQEESNSLYDRIEKVLTDN